MVNSILIFLAGGIICSSITYFVVRNNRKLVDPYGDLIADYWEKHKIDEKLNGLIQDVKDLKKK